MKHFIVGTAGHVDHGKTSLIKAMTGIDADRLREEKKRGITIDLGFAYMDLPHAQRVGIIDVPGHEKFIKNMLAGAGGIDLVMLVVAADEGVMPQTREHMDILSLLDMKQGIIVITKTDLADSDYVDLVEEEIREEVQGTFLQDAPILRVSAYTGEGLDELTSCLDKQLQALEEKDAKKPFRLPIDRAFTMTGFGTVVTGTVIEGQIQSEEDCLLYPDELPVKIRGIQVHSAPAQTAYAGQRTAVNLSNMKKEDIKRGYVLAPAGSMTPSMMLDVRLDILKDSEYSVKNNSRVHFYHGSAELVAKVVLLDRDELEPGQSCYAQLRFEEKMTAKKGDMFVIRFFSPLVTIGGGLILDANPPKKKRNNPDVLKGMEIKENGTDKEQLYQAVLEARQHFLTLPQLVQKGSLNRQTVKNNRNALVQEGKIIALSGDVYLTSETEARMCDFVRNFLKEFHKENTLKEGMPLQEFRVRALGQGREKDADALLEYWKEKKVLKEADSLVSLYEFRVQKQEDDEKIMAELEQLYLEAQYELPVLGSVMEQYAGSKRIKPVMTAMLKEGTLIKLDDKYLIHRDCYETAKDKVIELGQKNSEIVLGEYRDYVGASRKIALALLDYFDKQGITRKQGEARMLFRVEKMDR